MVKTLSFQGPTCSRVSYVKQPVSERKSSIDFRVKLQRTHSFLPQQLTENDKREIRGKNLEVAAFEKRHDQDLKDSQKYNKVYHFITGSKYIGEWSTLGMSGAGIYKFPHGVIYDGQFNSNGQFHGSGILVYPNGNKIQGFWKNGKIITGNLSKNDVLFDDSYCKMPDRRYQIEVASDIQPAYRENLTNSREPTKVPQGCYDAGSGFFDQKLHFIKDYNRVKLISFLMSEENTCWLDSERCQMYKQIQVMSKRDEKRLHLLRECPADCCEGVPALTPVDRDKEKWIIDHCRKAWDEPIGYTMSLYEDWTTGSKRKYDGTIQDIRNSVRRSDREPTPTNLFKTLYTFVLDSGWDIYKTSNPCASATMKFSYFRHDTDYLEKMIASALRKTVSEKHKSERGSTKIKRKRPHPISKPA